MIVLVLDDVLDLAVSMNALLTTLGLRMFSNSSPMSDGGSARDAIYSIMISYGGAGIVQGRFAVYAMLSSVEDVACALFVGPFTFLLKERKKLTALWRRTPF
jgi:hypothetical protein